MRNFARRFTFQQADPSFTPNGNLPATTIAFVGNPNCGKTTLFNGITGANLKVANWPGVTVEGKVGETIFDGKSYELVDLPGIYSLTSYTQEEEVARSYILSDGPDIVINVVNATNLERSLYLTLELIALGKPVVVALNMMDLAQKRGLEIDIHRLSEVLGAPVIPVCAKKREGLNTLMHACVHHIGKKHDPYIHFHPDPKQDSYAETLKKKHEELLMVYSEDLEKMIDEAEVAFEKPYPNVANPRWYAIRLLEHDANLMKEYPLAKVKGRDSLEEVFITERYDFIADIIKECCFKTGARTLFTDKLDKLLLNQYAAIPLFILIMGLVFFLTFVEGDVIKGVFEEGLDLLNASITAWLMNAGASAPVVSLLCDGVITGVGTVLTFLPNIFILFLALALLEDSGYMSRVAYVMNTIMSKVGLSGRASIPMILGFGCTVPAVMSTRTLDTQADRKRVMLVLSFMSCSARLPIYVLFSGLFFAEWAPLAALFMYVLGIAVALVTLKIVDVIRPARTTDNALIIELPDYKTPDAKTTWIYVWDKVVDYITRAGTIIFLMSVVIWLLMNLGPMGYTDGDPARSFAAYLGYVMSPMFMPLGCGDWRLCVALLLGISAKEVVVSSVSVLFGVTGSAVGSSALATSLAAIGFGPANALAFMTFCLLYVPCIATIATIATESRSRKFTFGVMALELGLAWCIAFIVYHIALLF